MADVKKLVKNSPVPLAGGDGTGKPVLKANLISLNGVDEDSHETLYIDRVFGDSYRQKDEKGFLFNFCKTATKPYDVVVTAILACFKNHFGWSVRLSSDGEKSDWQAGIDLCKKNGIELPADILRDLQER